MKAWVLHGLNKLEFEELSKPIPKQNETIVKVKAAGICSSDVPRVFITGAYYYPIVLGHEFSGVTAEGRRVGIFPLLPCFECESCQNKNYETCSNYSYIGSRQNGAFSEYVVVPKWNLIDLPDNVSFIEAAILEPAAVALHAVNKVDLTVIKNAVVVGNGTIGQLIAKWLLIKGIKEVFILSRNDTPVKADVYIEAVGSSASFKTCIENVTPGGQIILVGNPNIEFNIGQKLYWHILRKQIIIRGIWNSSYPSEWQDVLFNIDKLNLKSLISHIYHFTDFDKAIEMMYNKNEKYSKVLIDFDSMSTI